MSEWRRKYTRDKSARGAARVVALVVLAVGLALAYWLWPAAGAEMRDAPLEAFLWRSASLGVLVFTMVVVIRAWLDT